MCVLKKGSALTETGEVKICAYLFLLVVFVGPRFILNLIKILGGSFGGPVLYENPNYISPNVVS